MRYIPACMEDHPDPFDCVLQHIHTKQLAICADDPMTAQEGLTLLERAVNMEKKGWTWDREWGGLWLEGDVCHCACGCTCTLTELYQHLLHTEGHATCPVEGCPMNPFIKTVLPKGIYGD